MVNDTELWTLVTTAHPLPVESIHWTYTLLFLAVGAYCCSIFWSQIFGYKLPIFGTKSPWEPVIISNFRFFHHAEQVLQQGYNEVDTMKHTRKDFYLFTKMIVV